ncbi:MAG: hypothetical protein V4660_08565 [Pseudomonadota bacterium]
MRAVKHIFRGGFNNLIGSVKGKNYPALTAKKLTIANRKKNNPAIFLINNATHLIKKN